MKYGSNVRIISGFYEGRNGYIIRDIDKQGFYKVSVGLMIKKMMIDQHKTYIHESDLEFIK